VTFRRFISIQVWCILSIVLGAGSLLLFGVFLYLGALPIVDLGLDTTTRLALDAVLCLAFFLQHSVMVRSGFRRRLRRLVGGEFHGTLYSVVSGLVLVLLVVLWQATAGNLIEPSRPLRWLLRGSFCLALVGFAWSARTLRELDTFGLLAIRRHLRGRADGPASLNVRGPYRWVRHPFYFLSLVMI
jgi:protein-S-isoprenylcysteine O-methyltransferase Ste14